MDSQEALKFLQVEVTRLREENRGLKQELTLLRTSVRALNALQDLLQHITPGTDILKLLDDLLASALAVVGASDGSLLLRDEETGELVFAVVRGEASDRLRGYRLPAGLGIAGWVVANRQSQIVREVHNDARFYPLVDETFGFHTRSLACLPLIDGDRVLGVIEAINKPPQRDFTPQDHDLLQVVARLAAVALARAESFAEEASAP